MTDEEKRNLSNMEKNGSINDTITTKNIKYKKMVSIHIFRNKVNPVFKPKY